MGSLFLLLFIGFILAILVWIVIKVPWWAKPLIIIGAFLAVTADGYLGRRKLEKMCQEQGGLHIYKTVNNVEGFEQNMNISSSWDERFNDYSFIEGKSDTSGKVNRITRNSSGKVVYEKDVNAKSRYLVIYNHTPKIDANYRLLSEQIVDKKTKEILAEVKSFAYRGGWADRFVTGLYASKPSIHCPKPIHEQYRFYMWDKNISKILKPKKKEK